MSVGALLIIKHLSLSLSLSPIPPRGGGGGLYTGCSSHCGPTNRDKQMIKINIKKVKNANWLEVSQLTKNKRGRGAELWTTENKSS